MKEFKGELLHKLPKLPIMDDPHALYTRAEAIGLDLFNLG